MGKKLKQIISLILSVVLILSSAAFAFADDDISYSRDTLAQAVRDKDIKTIVAYYLSLTKDYYIAHGLDENFPYFNAHNYMEMYSSSDDSIKDSKSALDSYLDHGMLSGNRCGTDLDPYVVLLNHPELILNLNLQMLENEPDKFVAYLFYLYREAYSSAPSYEEQKSFTMMLFFCPSDLENSPGYCSTQNILKSVFGICGQTEINITLMLGGTKKWCSDYINGICCENESQYKNGIFSIDRDMLNRTVDSLCEKYGADISTLLTYALKVSDQNNPDKAITDDIIKSIFNEAVMPFTGYAGNISSGEAITNFINTSKTLYPADNYGLIINGHGAGSKGGSPYEASGNAPDAATTAEAFKAANVDVEPFTFIAYDSCLMGCTELAGVLKDYYQYLYASEEITYACYLNYFDLLNTIKDNIDSSDIGKIAVEKIFDSYYQGGLSYNVTLLTGSVYNASKVQDVKETLNNLSSALNSLCQNEADSKTVYNAMKLAAIKAFNIGSEMLRISNRDYYDLMDYLIELKTALGSMKSVMSEGAQNTINELISAQGEISKAIEAADNLTDSNFVTYDCVYIYENRDGLVQSNITKDVWTRYFGNNFCGASIFVPYLANALTSHDDAQIKLKSIQADYLDKYSGNGFENYMNLIGGYSKFCLSDDEINRVQRLAKELNYGLSASDGTTKVKSYKDITKVELVDLGENSSTLRVYANDYAEGDVVSINSSGNAVIDMMDTVDTLRVYVTRFMKAKDSIQNDIYIDVIIGQKDVKYVEQGQNGFTINADHFNDLEVLFALANDGSYEAIRSEDAFAVGETTVENLLCANDIINGIISNIRNDETKNEAEKYSAVVDVLQSYTLVKGQYKLTGSSKKSSGTDVYHVFDNRGQYIFTSERTQNGETETYKTVNPESIYLGHKVLNNNCFEKIVKYDDGDHYVKFDQEVCAETELGYTVESKEYKTADGIFLLRNTLSGCINAESVNNGYIFASYDYSNGAAVFNKTDNNGNCIAASIENSYLSLTELQPQGFTSQTENAQGVQECEESEPTSDQQEETPGIMDEEPDVEQTELTSVVIEEAEEVDKEEHELTEETTGIVSQEISEPDTEESKQTADIDTEEAAA